MKFNINEKIYPFLQVKWYAVIHYTEVEIAPKILFHSIKISRAVQLLKRERQFCQIKSHVQAVWSWALTENAQHLTFTEDYSPCPDTSIWQVNNLRNWRFLILSFQFLSCLIQSNIMHPSICYFTHQINTKQQILVLDTGIKTCISHVRMRKFIELWLDKRRMKLEKILAY